jgi:signal transduction histidine kinase
MELADVNDILESAIIDIKKRYEGERPNVKLILDSKLGQRNNEIKKAEGFKIHCDSSKISQTLMNLLDNAMKFTIEGEVVVTAWANRIELVISVRDSGSGIDPSIRDRLFEKFATKSNSGTGLGLYLSKKIVEAHGGRIWAVDNSDGRGTTFSFSIPNDSYPLTTTTNDILKSKVRQ